MIEIDKVLEKCGDFHRYQFMLLFLFCIINLLSSVQYYSQTIISFIPEHWCYHELLLELNVTEIRRIYEGIENPSCVSYDNVMLGDRQNESETEIIINKRSCTKFIYNYDFGYHSMTTELNWVCDLKWKTTVGQSMFFIGSVIGSLLFGILADKIGRLPVLISANMVAMTGNLSTMFCSSFEFFCVCRFIAGMATDSNFVMMYILVMEYIRPSMRTAGLSLCIGIFYCIGSAVTPWIAVYVGDWRMFLLVTGIPFLTVPLSYFLVVESAQWLVTKCQYDKAVQCLKRVAKFNGVHVEDYIFEEFKINCTKSMANSTKEVNMLKLFKTPRLRRNTLILFFKSMVLTLCYDAISRNVEGLGISPFIMFSLSASAIFPACIVLILLQDKIGRKAMASSSLLMSGVFTAASGLIILYGKSINGKSDVILVTTLAIIGRFGVTVAYNSGAQYATELIPTCVRGQGVAAVHVAGFAFTFLSSYIIYLSQPFPALILGVLSLFGAGLCLLLPETLNRTLPCTLEAAEEFGRGENIFQFSCFENRTNRTTSTDNLGC
ncbi:organic cation transporter protein-like [Condylostylus longicornis]|uniref:organic cation transporter protein-like n=1 Tax=Condylostylus longicornis TaxID=2530218 RepID=UPI00244D9EF5|nr:organic cation transporter protein-like [Condylostylus longicornis]